MKALNKKAVMDIFESLPEETRENLLEIMRTSGSLEEAIRRIHVGDCPVCGSQNTRDCEDTPLNDSTVGICLDCHAMWCLECGMVFKEGQTKCEHWEICDKCHFPGEDGCGIPTLECSIIADWKRAQKEAVESCDSVEDEG